MALRTPPPGTPVVKWESPNKLDTGLIEFHNSELAAYVPLDIGAAHPNSRDYPNHRLGIQAAVESDQKWIRRVWTTPNTNQEWFNYQLKYSAEATAFPIFIRESQELKETYVERARGSALQVVYKLKRDTNGSGYDPSVKELPLTFSGDGVGAAGRALISPDGTIAALVLDDGGSGYTTAPIFTIPAPAAGITATGTAYIQPTSAFLIQEEAHLYPADSENYALYFNVLRIYETLPGPWIPFTRYDDNLGPIQGQRRAVINTNQAASLTAISKTTYEGRDGSSIVSLEIVENYSNGTGDPSNPAYPINYAELYDDIRGAIHRRTQLVVKTGLEVASLIKSGTTITRTTYEPYNEFLLQKVIETWTVAGPTIITDELGIDNLTPAKYRGLVTRETTENNVGSDYVFPTFLTGDQVSLILKGRNTAEAILTVTEETINIAAPPLVGQRSEGRIIYDEVENLVVDGTPVTAGSLVMSSRVVPIGNGKSIKDTESWNIPSDEKFAFWEYVSLPLLLFGINHSFYCNNSQFFSLVTNYDSSGGASVLRKHRRTIKYSTTYPNPDLSASAYTTRDIRYQGKFVVFSLNNVLNDSLSYSEDFYTWSGDSACLWTESYTFSASSPSATAFAAGAWYTKSYEVDQWGTQGYRSIHTEFFSASGNPSI